MENSNARIMELQQVGMELYQRCEDWKKALIKIRQLTNDPIIIRLIERTFQEK